MTEKPIITRVFTTVQEIDATQWDALLAQQATPTPFMRHAYLAALQTSGSATPETGWGAHFITLWRATSDGEQLVAACPLYVKSHSWGEYVSLCRLRSIDQMTSSQEDGHNERAGECGAKRNFSLFHGPPRAPRAPIRAQTASITRR